MHRIHNVGGVRTQPAIFLGKRHIHNVGRVRCNPVLSIVPVETDTKEKHMLRRFYLLSCFQTRVPMLYPNIVLHKFSNAAAAANKLFKKLAQ